jgi:hypothetical protein
MNKTLLIVGGVAAVGIVGYMLLKKNTSAESTTSEGSSEQKAADTSATSTAPSNVNPALQDRLAVKGGTKTDISGMPVVSSKRGNRISSADFQKMEEEKIRISEQNPIAQGASRASSRVIKAKKIAALKDFAQKNNINYDAYMDVIRRSASVPGMSNETESYAFSLNF